MTVIGRRRDVEAPKLVTLRGERFYQWGDELYPAYLNTGEAARFVLHVATRFCEGKGIDIGGGHYPYPGAVIVDRIFGGDAYDLSRFENDSFDFAFSSHCLEHLDEPQRALSEWTKKVKHGGVVFLYLPHPAMKLWHPGAPWVGNGHKWMPEQQNLITMLDVAGCNTIGFSEWPDAYWSFWIAGRRR